MDENKVKAPKKVNIKNKKDATKTLQNSTIKGKTTSNKTKKTSTTKKTKTNTKAKMSTKSKTNIKVEASVVKEENNLELNKEINEEKVKEVKKEKKKKSESNIPNNIKGKVEKDNKKVNKKDNKKDNKKNKKDDNKNKKTKMELPKEWKLANEKNKESLKNGKTATLFDTQGFKGKIKSSIFEEVDEKVLIEQKKKQKEKLKKNLIITLIVICIIAVIAVALIKYNDFVKQQLAVYDVYKIGDKVSLKDNSIWYVVSDSDSKESSVILLKDSVLDVNNDNAKNDADRLVFNSEDKAEYNIENENSVAYFLNNTYKNQIEENVGNIIEVRLLSSKEYVKIRERMGYGYEWSSENWLANGVNSRWWIDSVQNDKVFVVTSKGTYTLVDPNTLNFIRPVIVTNKENVSKVEEQRNMRVDLINGLK